MIDAIIKQLQQHCDCMKDKDLEDGVIEKNVEEMIHLISLITCWCQEPCENFLMSNRTEIFEPSEIEACGCNKGIVEFIPFYYKGIVDNSFKVTVIETIGIEEKVTDLNSSMFKYSTTSGVLRVDLSDFVTYDQCCCPTFKKLIITYDAGFEELPDCLVDLFCDVLHVITAKNKCNCKECQACNREGEIVEYNEGVAENIGMYLDSLIEMAYKRQLDLISICGCRNYFTGVRV